MALEGKEEHVLFLFYFLFTAIWRWTTTTRIASEDNTYHGLWYTSRGVLVGTINISMGPLDSYE